MDKLYCLQAIKYYDAAIAAHHSPDTQKEYGKGDWVKSVCKHLKILEIERDFFIKELQKHTAMKSTKAPEGPMFPGGPSLRKGFQ